MSLRNIFRSLCLILGAPHDAHFPLGLIFPLNLSLSICPAEENIYLKFPLAFKTWPVAVPAAWLNASRPCFSFVSPATRAVTARTAAFIPLLHSSIISEYFGRPQKAKGPGFACKGKVAGEDPQTSLSMELSSCAASQSRRWHFLVLLITSLLQCHSTSLCHPSSSTPQIDYGFQAKPEGNSFSNLLLINYCYVRPDWLCQAAGAGLSGVSGRTQKRTSQRSLWEMSVGKHTPFSSLSNLWLKNLHPLKKIYPFCLIFSKTLIIRETQNHRMIWVEPYKIF